MTAIHPRLLEDCQVLGRFPLCQLLLMKDANYPWLILVPDRDGVSELYQLDELDQQQLMRESVLLSKLLAALFQPDKLNIAALGNVVAQLHLHHVVRYRHDAAWPAPVWGRVPPQPYREDQLDVMRARLAAALEATGQFRLA